MPHFRILGRFCASAALVFAVTFSPAASSPARAKGQPDELTRKIEAKAEEAARHFAAKDFAKAVRAYVEAYQIAQRPSELLYNIAFIYDRKLKEREMATVYYKKYAAAADADPELVEKSIVRIGELRQLQKVGKPDQTPKNTDENPAQTSLKQKPDTASEDSQADGAIAALVTGGTMMLVAGGLYVGAVITHGDFQTASADKRADLADSGRALSLTGDVLMGIGAVTALVGIIVYATKPQKVETTKSVKVGGHMLRDGFGLTFSGSM